MVFSAAATIALYIVLIFVLIFALIAVAALGVIAFALRMLNIQIDRAFDKADPIILKINDFLITLQRVTSNVGEKADEVLVKGEAIVEDIADKVEDTATVVQKTVTKPLINLSSIIAGITKGFATFSGSKNSNNGRN
jgi:uncharacterized protein YoxC